MELTHDPQDLKRRCKAWRAEGLRVGLVPTMGYLHAGHLSLIDYARKAADRVVVSVFVNPTQFGPNEDLERYPRDLPHDMKLAEGHGADLVFAPEPSAMYRPDHATWVEVPEMGKLLCGATRPIHFRGVCTVVLKLMNLVGPTVAVFGQKDWQQQAILKRMVRDLDVDVEIAARPIVREPDGLALSSRNVYLTPEERRNAPAIHAGLLLVQRMLTAGERDAAKLDKIFRAHLAAKLPTAALDYVSFVHPETLAAVARIEAPTLLAVAVRLSRVRLIDNQLLEA